MKRAIISFLMSFLSVIGIYYGIQWLRSTAESPPESTVNAMNQRSSSEGESMAWTSMEEVVPGENIQVRDLSGDKHRLRTWIESDQEVIVLRYFEENCLSCYEGFFDAFEELAHEHRQVKLVVLGKFRNHRDWQVQAKRLNLSISMGNVADKLTPMESEISPEPHLLWIQNLTIKEVLWVDRKNLASSINQLEKRLSMVKNE